MYTQKIESQYKHFFDIVLKFMDPLIVAFKINKKDNDKFFLFLFLSFEKLKFSGFLTVKQSRSFQFNVDCFTNSSKNSTK